MIGVAGGLKDAKAYGAFRISLAFFIADGAAFERLVDVLKALDPELLRLLEALDGAGLTVFVGDPDEALEEWIEGQDREWAGFFCIARQVKLGPDDDLPSSDAWAEREKSLAENPAIEAMLVHLRAHYQTIS